MLKKEGISYPSNFKIVDVDIKNDIYYCESITNKTHKTKTKLSLTSKVLEYLLNEKVLDITNINVGLYFIDYLPLENEKLILEDKKSHKIYPVQFVLYITLNNKIPHLAFKLKSLINNTFMDISDKYNWKYLHGSDTYMTDIEKMYLDTFIHKEYVLKVCNKYADYLEKEGYINDANDLRQRAIVHDNSKILNSDEFMALTSIINDKSCLRDANSKLSIYKQDAIELHWANNEHHPEHWKNINEMSMGQEENLFVIVVQEVCNMEQTF